MKNKNLLFKISIIIAYVLILSIIILSLLGLKERVGYLSEFRLNIDKTLEINGLDIEETKKLFEINDKLDVSSITNYIFTNNSITNYSYDFRIKYYSKVFRNSDIYRVYPNIDNILSNNGFIKEINIGESGSPFGNFISTKIIDTEKIDNVVYMLKIKKRLFFIISIIFMIFIMFIIYFVKVIKSYSTYRDKFQYDPNGIVLCSDFFRELKSKNIITMSNSIFIFYIFVLSSILLSVNYTIMPHMDTFFAAYFPYTFYNIFDYTTFQRGRHIGDILVILYMRPFGNIFINIFHLDPLNTIMFFKSIFSLIFIYLITFIISIFVWIINKKNNFKLIFIAISLYTTVYTTAFDYINLSAYIGSACLSMAFIFPMLYYFVYENEFLLFRNINLNYMLLFVLSYFATFVYEPDSTAISGLSFFMLIYFFNIKNKFFIGNNSKSLNIYQIFILFSVIILTIISFLLTLFGGRGQWQLERISNRSKFDIIISIFNNLDTFNKLLIIIGFIYIFYFIFKTLKYKKILKFDYICFSISFTSLFLIFVYFSVDAHRMWLEFILLFSLILIFLLKGINSNNNFYTLISSFILFFLIAFISLNLLNFVDASFYREKNNIKVLHTLRDIYIDAKENNLEEIVLTKDDIKKLELERFFDRNTLGKDSSKYNNAAFSSLMEKYYIGKYIPIIILDE